MRRYFTFRLKGSHFEKTVSIEAIWHYPPNKRASSQAAIAVNAACTALGGVAPDRLELVSWREA